MLEVKVFVGGTPAESEKAAIDWWALQTGLVWISANTKSADNDTPISKGPTGWATTITYRKA